jgi:EpsI family protein
MLTDTQIQASIPIKVSPTLGPAGRPWFAAVMWLGLAAGIVCVFGNAFVAMWRYHWFPAWDRANLGLYDRLVQGESYYTHAPLVPVVAGIIALLLIRHTSIRIRPRPILGCILLAACLGLDVLSATLHVQFVQGFAFVGVVAALVVTFWGFPALARLWFPILFLLAMMPVPPMVIAQLNFKLKLLAADVGVWLANHSGMLAERTGSTLLLPDGKEMVVGSACSGLRSLITLLSFGALYPFVSRLRGWWRLLLFASVVPVAIVSNCLRIWLLITVATFASVQAATGWFHDLSGVLIFVFALVMLLMVEKAILAILRAFGRWDGPLPLFHDVRRSDADAGQGLRILHAASSLRGVVALILVALSAMAVMSVNGRQDGPNETLFARASLPEVLQVNSSEYVGQDHDLDEGTLTILRTRDYVMRKYAARDSASGADAVDVCITYGRGDRRASHPPDVCLEGGGASIIAKGQLSFPVPGVGTSVNCAELVLQRGTQKEYCLYTYKCGKEYTCNWYMQQVATLTSALLQNDAGVGLVRITTVVDGNDVAQARSRSVAFMTSVVVQIHSRLP